MQKKTNAALKVISFISVWFLFLIICATYAHADFYVIAGSRGVGTKISSLPYTISSPGYYYIAKNLSCTTGTGIKITANNVTVDLMGFTIDGSGGPAGSDGINMNGTANVEIRNGTVRDFSRLGITNELNGGHGHRIINVRLFNNGTQGIYFFNNGNLIQGCTAIGNGSHGINTGYNSTAIGNVCKSNGGNGITAGTGTTLIGNTCSNSGKYGIAFWGGYNMVDQNTLYDNADGDFADCPTCVFGINVPASP